MLLINALRSCIAFYDPSIHFPSEPHNFRFSRLESLEELLISINSRLYNMSKLFLIPTHVIHVAVRTLIALHWQVTKINIISSS